MGSTAASHRPAFKSARLTPDLVSVTARKLEDRGPAPGVIVHNDDDYEASLQSLLAARAWQEGQDVWVFGYGSLLWNPAFDVVEQVSAVLPGWHRAFCIRLTRVRGTPEEPGLMMALVPGGSCRGALQRVAGERAIDDLRKLWRREMTVKPPNSPPRWVEAEDGARLGTGDRVRGQTRRPRLREWPHRRRYRGHSLQSCRSLGNRCRVPVADRGSTSSSWASAMRASGACRNAWLTS